MPNISSNPAKIDIAELGSNRPRILMVTPEVSYLPTSMTHLPNYISARSDDTADVSASLIDMLFAQGADVHVALPDYRRIIKRELPADAKSALNALENEGSDQRVHLAKDREFFYMDDISLGNDTGNLKRALFFQREVINNVLPYVQPDFIHCHDWMTGLIPAAAREMGIPCLFTFNTVSSARCPLSLIEDIGIDAALFWEYLYYDRYPVNYEESRDSNPVDLLISGIFAANQVTTGSPTFLKETVENRLDCINIRLRREVSRKWDAGRGIAIPNAPDSSYNPETDRALFMRYRAEDHHAAKQHNKLFLQDKLGLCMDSRAPVFFWPSRLDPFWKGCELLASIFPDLLSEYRSRNLQIVFVADGDFKAYFKEIVASRHLQDRVGICDFQERLERQAYAASDFVLIPSPVEPCGFPHMIGTLYGALPVAFDTGAFHDSLVHMNVSGNTGNGFLFKIYDPKGLFWAISEAMAFYDLPFREKRRQIERVMTQSRAAFDQELTASRYVQLYETILGRSLFGEQ